jgi:hypothetical protein
MNMNTETPGFTAAWLWKIPLIGATYFVATMISGAIVTATALQFPEVPGQVYNPVLSLLASIVLGSAVFLIARGLRGSIGFRWLVLFAFTYVSYCVNNQLESAIFSTAGSHGTMLIFFVLPCALIAGVTAFVVTPPANVTSLATVFTDRSTSSWLWRAVLAWLAFPVIYHVFGALIYPLVAEGYEGGELGLVVPSQGVILGVVSLRSLLFLAVAIPILCNWWRSRRSLVVALAVGFSVTVGVAGLIEATFLPTTMRIVHGLEITADSIVHAWVLVALLVPKPRVLEAEPAPVDAG